MAINVTFLPDNKTVKVTVGATIMQAAAKARVPIRSRCNRQAGCLLCKVEVDDHAAVFPKNEKERRKLGDSSLRLACQTKIKRSVIVTIPEDPLKKTIRALLNDVNEEGEKR